MRPLLAARLVPLLLAACAAPPKRPMSIDGPAVVAAVDAYQACARAAMAAVQGASRGEVALQSATVAVAQCSQEREAVRGALAAANGGDDMARTFADAYVEIAERNLVMVLAGAMPGSR